MNNARMRFSSKGIPWSALPSREGANPTNALKNCARTPAKINVRSVSGPDGFPLICSGYLEFDTNRTRPPTRVELGEGYHIISPSLPDLSHRLQCSTIHGSISASLHSLQMPV